MLVISSRILAGHGSASGNLSLNGSAAAAADALKMAS